jgi:hypothetical protein
VTDSAETSSFAAGADRGGAQTSEPATMSYSAPSGSGASVAADRPELAVGAAFAGGFLAALILKRIAR